MDGTQSSRLLLVDDDRHVLDGLVRILRRHFALVTAVGGAAGLETLQREGPFAVVVSDLRMPGLDGVAFLAHVRESQPDAVRVLLTGQADVDAAIAAVNEGQIFRFLTKPCAPAALLNSLAAAVEQHRLITAERVLLAETLSGSIKVLTDILALANPTAFGRAARAKQQVSKLAEHLGIRDQWQVEIAAMLSQVGSITLPQRTAEKVYYGKTLSSQERAMVERLPTIADELLANIPRLDPVRHILAYQAKHYDGTGVPRNQVCEEAIPLGARMLKIVLDFDVLEEQGLSTALALQAMHSRQGWYDPKILDAFTELSGVTLWDPALVSDSSATATTDLASPTRSPPVKQLPLRALRPGMILAEDITTASGVLLIARGHEVTIGLAERLRNLDTELRMTDGVRVFSRDPRLPR